MLKQCRYLIYIHYRWHAITPPVRSVCLRTLFWAARLNISPRKNTVKMKHISSLFPPQPDRAALVNTLFFMKIFSKICAWKMSLFLLWIPITPIMNWALSFLNTRGGQLPSAVSYTHLRAHETVLDLVC